MARYYPLRWPISHHAILRLGNDQDLMVTVTLVGLVSSLIPYDFNKSLLVLVSVRS